jgi:hypothetical protein
MMNPFGTDEPLGRLSCSPIFCAIASQGHVRSMGDSSLMPIPFSFAHLSEVGTTGVAAYRTTTRGPSMQKTFTKMAISSPFTDTRGPPSALETHLTTGQWMPHHDNNPSKKLILCQEAHLGYMSILVSARSALGAHTGQERTASAKCLFVIRHHIRRAAQAM